MRRRRRRSAGLDVWPAFSDLVFNALAIFIFYMLAQFLINQDSMRLLIVEARQSTFEGSFRDFYEERFGFTLSEQIRFSSDGGEQRLSFEGSILFDPGSTQVSESGRELLAFFAESLDRATTDSGEPYYNAIRVAGYTDRTPLAIPQTDGSTFTNWELSALRATSVVKVLIDAGVDPTMLSGTGYGEYQAQFPADASPEELATDRKIEIVLFYSISGFQG